MRCGPNRFFDVNFKACVLKGSTRSVRRDDDSDKPTVVNVHSDFSCKEKTAGKYPDDNDCHLYHLCLPAELYAPFDHLTVKCPSKKAYDPKKKRCTKKARKRCKKPPKANFYCDPEIRFRETTSCSRYFLCYRDQIFEFSCPPGFQFDESLQFCEPEHFVACE